MAVPLITGVLALASTLSIDSRLKTERLKGQYATLGARDFILHYLSSTSTPPGSSTSTITLNGRTTTTTLVKLGTLPRDLPFTTMEENKLLTTKVID